MRKSCTITQCRRASINWKPSPNAFVSLRISSPAIHRGLHAVQEGMVGKDEAVRSALTPLVKLHITLSVIRLENEDDQERYTHSIPTNHTYFLMYVKTRCSVVGRYKILGVGQSLTNITGLLTSNSYCLLDCICLTQISSWLIIGWAGPPLLRYWVQAPLAPLFLLLCNGLWFNPSSSPADELVTAFRRWSTITGLGRWTGLVDWTSGLIEMFVNCYQA